MLKRLAIASLGIASILLTSMPAISAVPSTEGPEATLKAPKLVPEDSISTWIPSESAPGLGLAVNLVYPEKARYPDGAPVAVVAPGGVTADGLSFTMHAAQVGCIEVRFAFPGGGSSKFHSGGIYDYRGTQSQLALKDVLLFAAGKIADTKGHYITDLVPMKVEKSNVGLVGWSNGGNVAMVTLGKYADELKSVVSWVLFYESPIGNLFYPPNLGGIHDLLLNKHYRQGSAATGSCNVDWKKLTWWQNGKRTGGERKKLGEVEIPGVLYFDENGNGVWDESVEYALNYATDVGLEKQIYPPEVAITLETRHMFDKTVEDIPLDEEGNPIPDKKKKEPPKKKFLQKAEEPKPEKKKMKHIVDWPKNMATVRESEAYFQDRDGSAYYAKIAKEYPNLMIIILATVIDHLQKQPDHPHIAMQYNSWLLNKAHWVKINPEGCYLAQITGLNFENFSNNRPNASIDASMIATYLEQEGTTKDYVMAEGAVAELADRRRSKISSFPLPAPITLYYNRLNPPPPPPPPKKEE
ncbi:MAG TPA: hypothetical protein V6C76_05000 [Drouetiella sp.]